MTWSIPGSTDPGPVREVREGMHVVGVDGERVQLDVRGPALLEA